MLGHILWRQVCVLIVLVFFICVWLLLCYQFVNIFLVVYFSYLLDVGMTYVSNFLALLSPSLGAPTGTSALPAKSTAVTDPQVDLTGIDSVIRLDSNALVDDGVEQV